MYLLVLYLPFLSAFVGGFFGRYLGTKGVQIFSISCLLLTFITSLGIFYEILLKGTTCTLIIFNWFNIGLFKVNWACIFDPIGAVMLIVVTFISLLVHIYSIEYMRGDPFISRFMSYLSFFTGFMLILVTSDNFIQLFLGWEGVGLVSYFLINFWFSILEANKSAIKAIIVNRVGDIGVALGIGILYIYFKSVDFNIIFPIVSYFQYENQISIFGYPLNILDFIGILFFIGAIGKSAQLGLHTWLPDAMAGPTPVSALIHAATMVTAGVFLLIRISPILEYTFSTLLLVSFFGVLTSFFAASIGLFQNDLKKIIAYSTCSQLGYMIFICGLSNYSLSLFHLTNHAFFKALLFLSAGSIIHALQDEQDIRKMGGLIQILPFTYSAMLIGSLALMGIPFLTGFYSKDLIIETSFVHYNLKAGFIYWLSVISAFFTSFYSIRLLYYTFLVKTNAYKSLIKKVHEAPFLISLPLFLLAINSIFFGYLTKDLFIGLGTDIWQNSIFTNKKNILLLESEFLPFYIKNIPFFFSMLGLALVIKMNNSKLIKYFFNFNFGMFFIIKGIWNFFIYKWYFDVIYNKYIVKFFFKISYKNLIWIDRGIIEIIGPLGFVRFFHFLIKKVNNLQTGYIFHYLFIMIVFIIGYFISLFLVNLISIYNIALLLIVYFYISTKKSQKEKY